VNRYCWLAAVVVLGGLAGPVAAQDKPYVWKEGRVEALFPGTPKESKDKLELTKGGVAYLVIRSEVPDLGKTPGAETLFFDVMRGTLVKALQAKLISEKELKVDDAPGRELLLEVPNLGVFRMRFILVGNRMYQVSVMGRMEAVTGKEAEAFFKSFKLLK
jgi:hypothetical protein